LVPVTFTFAVFFVASAQVVDGNVVVLFTVTFVLCTVNVTLGHAPVEPEMAPVSVVVVVVGVVTDTLVASTDPSLCLVPVTVTFAVFFVASAHVVDGYVVVLFTVTFVLCTVNVTAGHVPVEPEIAPVSVVVVVAGVVTETLVASTDPSLCFVPVTFTDAVFFVASAHDVCG
jgi:hypothetical protein